ncbi:MAG: hypothetical protein EOP48_14625, partial [Sphingobacteriales bacterium]
MDDALPINVSPLSTDSLLLAVSPVLTTYGIEGTGFFYVPNKSTNIFFVTCRHVLVEDSMEFRAHHQTTSGVVSANVKSFRIDLPSVICPRDGTDLAAIQMDFEFHQRNNFKKENLGTFVRMVPLPAPNTLFMTRGGFHPTIMIGFPYGHMDIVNNLPIWRTGFTASHPLVNYKGKNQGLNNIDCFPADSGAPVIAMIDLSVPDINNNTLVGQHKQFCLLGIHSEGLHSDESKGL